MASHRSSNFNRLKELLPSVPAADPQAVNSDPFADGEPLEPPFIESKQRSTAAVQRSDVLPSAHSTLVAKPGKSKLITRPSTFRLAVELQDALKTVADYNRLSMTDIVAESIWLHLQGFAWPDEAQELRKRLAQLL